MDILFTFSFNINKKRSFFPQLLTYLYKLSFKDQYLVTYTYREKEREIVSSLCFKAKDNKYINEIAKIIEKKSKEGDLIFFCSKVLYKFHLFNYTLITKETKNFRILLHNN